MNAEYRVEVAGSEFVVIDPWNEKVGTYQTEDAAKKDIERCQKEDAMWESAKLLVRTAIEAHMEAHGVDRKTSSYWINSALGGT